MEMNRSRLIGVKKQGEIDIDWLKRLRQRSKISFSKDRFDNKLKELEARIESLHKIRKHVEHFNFASDLSQAAPPARVTQLSLVRVASSRLHEVLSSLWQCETAEEHFVNIGLDDNGEKPPHNSPNIHFELAWSFPGQGVPPRPSKPLRLSVDSLVETRALTSDASPTFDLRQTLGNAVEESLRSASSQAQSLTITRPDSDEIVAGDLALPDLRTIPNLCNNLMNQPPGPVQYLGFLQKSKTFKHFICTPFDQSRHVSNTKSLKDALVAAKASSEGIPVLEKLNLAKILALAVLQFHSTPWLKREWQSQDVVFFGIQNFAEDPLRMPYLKSRVLTQRNTTDQQVIISITGRDSSVTNLRSSVRNQTLYSLGVMLIELAYDSPLQDLKKPEDDQGDPHTLFWAATRLGDRVIRELGPIYADAVKICLHGAFGASSELEDMRVQRAFFVEVVQKLEKCAKAVVM